MPSSGTGETSRRPPTLLALPSYLAGSVAALGNRRLIALLKREGIALQQFAVLVALADFGVLAPNELATRLHSDRSHISAAVDMLTKLDLVVRTPDELDRRRVSVDLAPAGRDLVTRIGVAAADSQRRFLDALSEQEQATLRGLLLKVIVADDRADHPVAAEHERHADARLHQH